MKTYVELQRKYVLEYQLWDMPTVGIIRVECLSNPWFGISEDNTDGVNHALCLVYTACYWNGRFINI
jgi:hypothetical protein